ncbi:SH3 domain-containing protein [Rhodoblastus sp.]|jgi:SH3-like domain-containing protein|uniref:SH3 domain-containing protein n=1 Tax=Rhodoblastus sp. TaxID=1962975 RepID=UPI0025DF1079|nr:SH3 domain-containing protein [Rhodoblastus sp.]
MANGPLSIFSLAIPRMRRVRALAAGFLGAFLILGPQTAEAQQAVGPATGLPVPRYVSLKSDHVNLREGPSKDHATKWIYQRAGLPVEITAEYETWRRIRDSEGSEGWVLHSLLSGKRSALIAPWKKDAPPFPLRAEPQESSNIVAKLAPGVIASVKKCDGSWCRLKGDRYDGYMSQTLLWGVYPGEKVE